ncbi:MAG TPA: gamma-glutamylcyclotransferase [bacterium]|nr:gamma-glutamylcyclotransferase [bacterium]HPQ66667.1 gamma-glutamylcyclotransferase [bacterium]
MTEKLFSYGTLRQENVQIGTFGRKLKGSRDTLAGYVLARIRIEDSDVVGRSGTDVHPIIKYTGKRGDRVEGIIFEITEEELEKADEYEVEAYSRVKAAFESGVQAWVYVDASSFP